MKDKTIVEYHTRGGVRARIHYVMMHENGQAEDYLSEYMQEVYSGVFSRNSYCFRGESSILHYGRIRERRTADGERKPAEERYYE